MGSGTAAVLLVLFSLGSAPAIFAEEPHGFGTLPWGTTRELMSDRLLREQCRSHQLLERVSGRKVICFGYLYPNVGVVDVTFDFAAEALHGYEVVIPAAESAEFRKRVLRELGPPRTVTGMSQETLTWYWPSGTTAMFEQRCFGTAESCFTVATGAPLGTTPPSHARATRPAAAPPR